MLWKSSFGGKWGQMGPNGAKWGHRGPSGAICGPIWGHLGPFGAIWGHLGPFLGPFLGPLLEQKSMIPQGCPQTKDYQGLSRIIKHFHCHWCQGRCQTNVCQGFPGAPSLPVWPPFAHIPQTSKKFSINFQFWTVLEVFVRP